MTNLPRSKCFVAAMTIIACSLFSLAHGAGADNSEAFVPLTKVPAPKILDSAARFPASNYLAENMVDGNLQTEYASDSLGTKTFIDFDFGKPVRLAAFEHIDRRDAANVDTAELIFSDTADFSNVSSTVAIDHVGTRGARTLVNFPAKTARYVRWRITRVTSYDTVGGSELAFYALGEPTAAPTHATLVPTAMAALVRQNDTLWQPGKATITYPYARPVDAVLDIKGREPIPVRLTFGTHTIETLLPAVKEKTAVDFTLKVAGNTIATSRLKIDKIRRWEMIFLPHSHVDIGYTHVQTDVEKLQWQHIEDAIALVRKTADYPAASQFKWNVEVLWAVDGYLKQASPEKRAALVKAVRAGKLGIDGLYGNELTALCRPEELLRLFDYGQRFSKEHKVPIDSAMISDVPGYTWGIVSAMAQSGIKYFSIGPNHCHRIGYTLSEWGDKPFYWVGPSGKDRVLVWMAGKAYSWFHPSLLAEIRNVRDESLFGYLAELEAADYPYDMVQLRYSVGGDNGPPDADLPEFVRRWNTKYVWPRLSISTTSKMFHEFEDRYKDRIPEFSGDFTPYWEDGAGS